MRNKNRRIYAATGATIFTLALSGCEQRAASSVPWIICVCALALCLIALLAYINSRKHNGAHIKQLQDKHTEDMDDVGKDILRNEEMLELVIEAVTILLTTELDRFEEALTESMEKMAVCLDVDRVNIWRTDTHEDMRVYTLLYEWLSPDTDAAKAYRAVYGVDWVPRVPQWEDLFQKREYIAEVTSAFTGDVQQQFSNCGIQAIMAFPVYLQDKFWGFVSFDNCHSEKLC